MGIAVSGIIRAEGNTVASVLTGDRIVIQRYQSNNNGSYWVPYESTVGEIASFTSGGKSILAIGQATLNGSGTVTVALPAITAGALVFATENNATAAAISVVVTASTGFVLHSSNGSDASVVNYIVYQ